MRKTKRRPQSAYQKEFYRINERITCPQIMLIDDEGKNMGTISTVEALQLARSKELDLVEVSPKAVPPIAKILDYGKFKYQKEKEAQKQKARQKKIDIKGIRLSLRIGEHDRDLRLKQAEEFLKDGHKLKLELVLKGRERQYMNMAREQISQFMAKLNTEKEIKVEQPLVSQQGRLIVILASKN